MGYEHFAMLDDINSVQRIAGEALGYRDPVDKGKIDYLDFATSRCARIFAEPTAKRASTRTKSSIWMGNGGFRSDVTRFPRGQSVLIPQSTATGRKRSYEGKHPWDPTIGCTVGLALHLVTGLQLNCFAIEPDDDSVAQ
jgi:hypothetical protein